MSRPSPRPHRRPLLAARPHARAGAIGRAQAFAVQARAHGAARRVCKARSSVVVLSACQVQARAALVGS
eukprot:724283-Pyramimonas_sp.AAC.1